MTDTSCVFCRIAAGDAPAHVVWADAEHVAFLDRSPVASGHVLVIPRAHVGTVDDLAPDAHARLFARVRTLAAAVARAAGAPRTGIAVEGFGVAHAHVHLVPVWRGGDLDPCRQRPASDAELDTAAARLRALLAADDRAPARGELRGAIAVRRAEAADLAAVAALAQEVQAVHAAALPDVFQPATTPVTSPAALEQLAAQGEHLLLVAVDRGEVVGYAHAELQSAPATAYKLANPQLHVHAIGVAASRRRRGAGSALVAALRAEARERGLSELSLEVYAFNEAARRFYEREGFVRLRERMVSPL